MEREKVGERMRKIRELKGFSLEDVMRHSGLDQETIAALENGRVSPSLANLTR
ncbi:MAG: helix-turn-helix transcriptional regulator, partial [Proteobacteria bacterium]|nr:helix-turn-helix transcriptional regulator [Pseudomonadota bacterium]